MSSLLKKFLASKHIWLILTLILTLPAVFALLKPGYYNMHDDMQMLRQLELEKCLTDGQIPCRWNPDPGFGYGYPLFHFYPPMPYFVGQVFRTLGVSFMWAVKLTAVTQFLLSSLFMYLLAASLFGGLGGFVAALFFTYAPYHSVNIYVRGAMNEAWAAVWFPLIFYFTRQLILKPSAKLALGLGIAFSFLMLSHNPMLLTFLPAYAVWTLFWLLSVSKINRRHLIKSLFSLKPQLLHLITSAVIAFGLAAFYFLPVVFESKLVQIDTMFSGYYHFSVHFASFKQLFISNFWGDGASVWGTEDNMSFMIGYLHWIIPVILGLFISLRFLKTRRLDTTSFLFLILTALGFLTAFMAHERSTPAWLALPLIQKIQFPWRFLNHTVFLLSLAAGFAPVFFQKINPKYSVHLTLMLALLILGLNYGYFRPLTAGPLTDAQKFSSKAWTNLITSGIYDYLPKTARIAAQKPAGHIIDEISPNNQSVQIGGLKKGTDWFYFNANVTDTTQITLAQMYFPDFRIYDNEKPVQFKVEPELGRMVITLKPGYHQIYAKLHNTPVRSLSNLISFTSWLLLSAYLLKPLWKRLIFRK